MANVLLIGLKPDAVDYTDPDLPPGLTAQAIAAGIERTLGDMRHRGWHTGFCALSPDDTVEATIAASLTEPWDCVVIGGGIRIPTRNLRLLERVINAVHRGAPSAAIAFNSTPLDSADAAARWLSR